MQRMSRCTLTPPYARFLFRLIRPFPNFDFFFVKSLRRKAVRLLDLKPGSRVLDAGCGPGGSFPYLVDAVGPAGEVTGVEISPELASNARRRIEKNKWNNVQVVVGDARNVQLPGKFDALLMMGAPDVYASSQALDNLFACLSEDARVVAFGAKFSQRRFGNAVNSAFGRLFSKLTFPSTPAIDFEPWVLLKERVNELHVEESFHGWMFLGWGSKKSPKGTAP